MIEFFLFTSDKKFPLVGNVFSNKLIGMNVMKCYDILYSSACSYITSLHWLRREFLYVFLALTNTLSYAVESFYLGKFYGGNDIFLFMMAASYVDTKFKPALVNCYTVV